MRVYQLIFLFLSCFSGTGSIMAQDLKNMAGTIARDLLETYHHLHRNPELSLQERSTSLFLQQQLQAYGFKITGPIGGYGFAGVLSNGPGPVVMIRTDMDALPVEENTEADYASKVNSTNIHGQLLPVMHACGHDIHMTSWLGTAQLLSKAKDLWQGTVVFLAQPAEEFGDGARKMINDGLFNKIPLPDYALALHVSATLPVGTIGIASGYAYANVDDMEITVYGSGGHGAYPHTTIDPVVLAARIVLALQTLVSREFSPLEPVVITVGAINGGSKGNIIPDQVHLQMTIRYYRESLRQTIIDAIQRLTIGIAQSAGLPENKYPKLSYYPEHLPGVFNDPTLTKRLENVWMEELGAHRVESAAPTLGGEDFGRFGTTEHKIPICIYWLGSISQDSANAHERGEIKLPSLHSSQYLPLAEPTLNTGIESMSRAVIHLLPR